MSKIIQVINSMIINSEKISNIEKKDNTFYFSYKDYIWSIVSSRSDFSDTDIYLLIFYPNVKTVSEISNHIDWSKKDYIVYSTTEFKTQEAFESFNQLYYVIKEKFYKLDKMFMDIIGDTEFGI